MQDIKRRIKSVTSIEHITNAMKLVSAAKLRRAKATFERTQAIFREVTDSIAGVMEHITEVPEQYRPGGREVKRSCLIVVTSNRGLAGSFNSNVLKEAERLAQGHSEKPLIACVGSKGRDYFAKRGYEILASWTGAPESVTFADTGEIAKAVIEKYDGEEIDEVVLIGTIFKSTLEQHVESKTLLPFDSLEVSDGSSAAGGDAEGEGKRPTTPDVEYEPSAEEVLSYLVPKYAEIALYGAVIESATCEHAARRIAMENATDNAHGMIDSLGLFYNRARQAAITKEITEIVSGSEAVS
ncbi:MAG: ATP synthase F1 subunit gamma [Clostridiales Family XIII bacterium]|jgi:F-type H+-transporting ATPase subunit gamma|nr:ATP synthase F1 subunit gamma [Clostridiales Family XIII bacterium]